MLVPRDGGEEIAMLRRRTTRPGGPISRCDGRATVRPVRCRTTTTTTHQPTTAPIMRQNATTEPVDSDHLMVAELIEKLKTANATAASRSGTDGCWLAHQSGRSSQASAAAGSPTMSTRCDRAGPSGRARYPPLGRGARHRPCRARGAFGTCHCRTTQPFTIDIGAVHMQTEGGRRNVRPGQHAGEAHLEVLADAAARQFRVESCVEPRRGLCVPPVHRCFQRLSTRPHPHLLFQGEGMPGVGLRPGSVKPSISAVAPSTIHTARLSSGP